MNAEWTRRCGAIGPLLATALWLSPELAQARIEAHFAADTPLAALTAAELGATKSRADAVLPDLNDAALVDQLIGLADRKVEVRVVIAGGADGAPMKCAACDRLELHGADVRTTETRVLHRFLVLDGPRGKKASGVLGRLVLLDGALSGGRDAGMLTMEREGDYILSYQDEFNFLWAKGKDHDDKARNERTFAVTPPKAAYSVFTSQNMTALDLDGGWLLSPAADTRGVQASYLAGAIDQSFDQVQVSAPALKSLEVYQALERALERGVMVRLVVEAKEFQKTLKLPNCLALPRSDYQLMDECLAQLGADVRYTRAAVRSGMIVVDGKVLYAGNYRLSRAAEMKALGSVMMLRGAVVKSFQKHFEQALAAAKPSPQARGPKTMASVASIAPGSAACVSIRPAALTFEEMQKWRAIYRQGMCD